MALFLLAAVLLSATDELWAAQMCCPGMPCYDDSPPYNGLPPPQCPEDMNMVMMVYTRENPSTGATITRNSIPSAFKPQTKSMIIVHGFFEDEQAIWMQDIKNVLLAKVNYNVIVVGWKGGANNPYYPQAASNTRTVGTEIALVVNNTINKGLSSKALMYCVGASLGAHVCGHAGQWGQIGRITGLDPAGPIFEDRDWSIGLNPSCADLVEAIHTDGRTATTFGLGTMKRLGHVDFYPNGGNQQPGCALSPPRTSTLDDFFTSKFNPEGIILNLIFTCGHARSAQLFNESISTPCFLSRYSCTDETRLPESCTESRDAVQSMGFNADAYPGRGIFFLPTRSFPPFCRG